MVNSFFSVIQNKKWVLLLFQLVLLPGISLAEENWPLSPPQDPSQKEMWVQHDLGVLRAMHESSIFLLKRYATLDALVGAVEGGHSETEAFWIGASSLLPGTGQLINHDYESGGLMLFANALSWSTVQQLSFTRKIRREQEALLPWYYSALFLRNGIMTYSTLHACNAHYRRHRDRTAAMWTGSASMLPGLGQALNNDWWEAAGCFAAWTLAAALTSQLESQLFVNGDDGYWVKDEHPQHWYLAALPGGAALTWQGEW